MVKRGVYVPGRQTARQTGNRPLAATDGINEKRASRRLNRSRFISDYGADTLEKQCKYDSPCATASRHERNTFALEGK